MYFLYLCLYQNKMLTTNWHFIDVYFKTKIIVPPNFLVYHRIWIIKLPPHMNQIYLLKNNCNSAPNVKRNYSKTMLAKISRCVFLMASLVLLSMNGFAASENALDDCTPSTWYRDYDGDGYGSMYSSVSSCVKPNGYVADNTDCNDYNANVNPGMSEIYYNGYDDNCNTSIDDGAMILTQVQAQFAGITLPEIGTTIYADAVASASGYRFEVINISTGVIQAVETTNPYFKLTDMPLHNYGETYRISVMVRRFFVPGNVDVWLSYFGPPRMVTTPTVASLLVLQECGAEIGTNGILNATTIPGATQYRFMVRRHANDNTPVVFTQSSPTFNINQVYAFVYGATYQVAVSVKIGQGPFSAYGNFCTVGTASTDDFTIKQCGMYYGNFYSQVSTNVIPFATEYRFLVKNVAEGTQQIIQTTSPFFYINQIQDVQILREYAVSIAVRTAGGWSQYGPMCSIFSPPIGIKVDTKAIVTANFRVIASPNPFSDSFSLKIVEGESGTAHVKVYDMVGKLVDAKSATASDVESFKLGTNLPAGVYNVLVTQGDSVKSLKVIKR